ncbi:thioredoxin family protein [Corallococcus sp. AB032C]|uniref:redoxin domain-containing protein n=1 Tax=Corallococcus TaxID=83461 RepID=UPI000ECCDB8E|nr:MULTISPECIES: redoxin domain-containing protein [Corallococcus]NNB85816.1 redoxin domain-containing protein [Corallococcus exiguus]NPC49425.1 redoxin domain-containing protein [Corallococcus exiguus]RKH78121.1 thioredoxin family protein [Corallococcus sp. AB032C]
MKQVFKALALTAAFVSAPVFAADNAEVGKPAPAFTLKDEAGKAHSLSEYKGKVVVLEWTNPECPFVKRHYEAKTMQTTQKGFDAKKVVWLTVDSSSTHNAKSAADWKKKEGFSQPVLLDTDGAVGKSYAAKTTPHMYVIDGEGVVRYAGAIDNDPRGKEATKVNYVQTAVDALINGKQVANPTSEPYGCSVKYKS